MGFSGFLGASGADKGIKVLKKALAFQKKVHAETTERVDPFIDIGTRALKTLSGDAQGQEAIPSFRDQEFFKFREDEVNRAVRRGLSLRGNLFSGAGLEAETRANLQLSGEETANERNMLFNLANMGLGGVQTFANAGNQAAANVSNTSNAIANMQATRGQLLGGGIDSLLGAAAGGAVAYGNFSLAQQALNQNQQLIDKGGGFFNPNAGRIF